MNRPVLYILMRNDLESLNAGKAVAQGAHAANQFTHEFETSLVRMQKAYLEWLDSCIGFGTTITLSVNEIQLGNAFERAYHAGFPASIIHDPTYPIKDGKTVHHVPLDTCGYVFGMSDELIYILGDFPLMD